LENRHRGCGRDMLGQTVLSMGRSNRESPIAIDHSRRCNCSCCCWFWSSLQVCHGDIKSENVMVTSWNWVLLTDFASFKPTYLPEVYITPSVCMIFLWPGHSCGTDYRQQFVTFKLRLRSHF